MMSDSESAVKRPMKTDSEVKKQPLDWKTLRIERKRQLKEWKERKLIKSLERKQKVENSITPEKTAKDSKDHEKDADKIQLPTVSIAIPGSILDNAQSPELRTLLAGQIARAASISCVDEVIVYDETGSSTSSELANGLATNSEKHGNPNIQLARILQYLECPQYLRKYFFPLHRDLKHAGLLPPLDSPHHLRESDQSTFREGVVLERPVKEGHGSFVNVGLRKDIQLNKKLDVGLRVTVRLSDQSDGKKRNRGEAVDPMTPRSEEGVYWGYNVRLAQSLGAVFARCPYSGGYDLTIGTSDKGDPVDELEVLPPFRHLLIVFGGLKGLEYGLDCDESLTLDDPKYLFHHYINAYPGQGSRTIRTEEAVLLTMAILRQKIQENMTIK